MTTQQRRNDASYRRSFIRELLAAWAIMGLIATVLVISNPALESQQISASGATEALLHPTCGAPLVEYENEADRVATLAGSEDEEVCSGLQPGSGRPVATRLSGHALTEQRAPAVDQGAAERPPTPTSEAQLKDRDSTEPTSSTRPRKTPKKVIGGA